MEGIQPPKIGIIIPCFNEAEVLVETNEALQNQVNHLIQFQRIAHESFIAFVDDGSSDATWHTIAQLKAQFPNISALKLSRNFGHQNALLAGLNHYYLKADCLISLDADLQDDVEVIGEMIQQFQEGYELVYGVRSNRSSDSLTKKMTAIIFYRLMQKLGVEIIYNHADFRLMSRKVVEALQNFEEVNLFLRGIFPLIGFPHTQVTYKRKERKGGKSKYSFRKMLSFALDGITSFSVKPLRLVTSLGFLVFFLSLGLAAYAAYSYFFSGTVKGWTSIVLPIYFLGGIQLLAIGILGEYLGKIYSEVKKRPRYIIEKSI